METKTTVEEYTESDGTKVVKKTIITRTKPSGSAGSGGGGLVQTVKPITSSTTASQQSSSLNDSKAANQFEEDCLRRHNEYRAKHGVPPLKLSRDLCKLAQEWADKITSNNGTCNMQHRPNNKFGENIFWASDINLKMPGIEPVDSWYSEIKDYRSFGSEPPSMSFSKTGHFTQVVWKSSERMGVGKAVRGNAITVVANYDPAGNFVGNYRVNVLPPK